MRALNCLLLVSLFIASAPSSHAALLVWDTGTYQEGASSLIGADDILIANELYDVRFLTGSCVSLYSGCDSADDFLVNGIGASAALLDQVFNLDLGGLYLLIDLDPSLTAGCEGTGCLIYTPDSITGGGGALANIAEPYDPNGGNSNNLGDEIKIGIARPNQELAAMAVWSLAAPAAVPAPPTIWLFATGLFGLLVVRRSKSQIAASS